MESTKSLHERIFISKKDKTIEELEREVQRLQEPEAEFRRRNEYEIIHTIAIDRICPSALYSRRESCDSDIIRLADSIRQHGVLQPIIVRRVTEDDAAVGGLYTLVAGSRRIKALKLLGQATVPCVIVEADAPGAGFLSIVDNYHRHDLNFFEQAYLLAEFMSTNGIEIEEAAMKLSVPRSFVEEKLKLMKYSPAEKELILDAELSEEHAHALLRIEDEGERLHCLRFVIQRQMTVAAAVEFVDGCFEQPPMELKGIESVKRRLIQKDMRIFYNSVERAVEMVQRSGVPAILRRTETMDEYEIVITLPRAQTKGGAASIETA
ncbi:MAG: ParB/RepB/Spo0J family partition protein [Oscillospiraceae bacterium]|nr:ParB/RepB/Spo0J family partition protein [Oscillospiraceae bacterium]